jgi:glycosyltransferase involved in cell wall biosynthesis
MSDEEVFRLCLIVADPADAAAAWSGVLQRLLESGIDVQILLSDAEGQGGGPFEAWPGIRTWTLPIRPGPSAAVWVPMAVAHWVEHRPHVVHVIGDGIAPAAIEAAHLADVAVVVTSLGGADVGTVGSLVDRLPTWVRRGVSGRETALRALHRRAARVLTMAPEAAEALLAAGIAAADFERFDNGLGIEVDRLRERDRRDLAPAVERNPGERLRLLVDVRGVPIAQQGHALGAVRRIRASVPGVTALVLLDSNEPSAWDRQSGILVLPVNEQAENLALASCDLVLAVVFSGWVQRTVMRAAALRLATVTTDVAQGRALVRDGETGRVVNLSRPGDLEAALAEAADQPAVREGYGARAARFASRLFDSDLAVQRLVGLYDRLLSDGADAVEPARLSPDGLVVPQSQQRPGLRQHMAPRPGEE